MLEIIEKPNPILTKQTDFIQTIDEALLHLLDEMYETMIAYDGVGIAAPQVNQSIRVAVVQLDEDSEIFELINPVILKKSGKDIDVEGCLSMPELFGTVERAEKIKVRYLNRYGEKLTLKISGYLARIFQHEIDHLDGILFDEKIIQKMTPEELEEYTEEV